MADQINLGEGILPPPTIQNDSVNLGQISLTVQNAVVDCINNSNVNIINDLPSSLIRIGSTTYNVIPSRPIAVSNEICNNNKQPTIANYENGTMADTAVYHSSFYNNFPTRFNDARSTNGEHSKPNTGVNQSSSFYNNFHTRFNDASSTNSKNASVSQHIQNTVKVADKISSPEPEKQIKNLKRKVVAESEIDFTVSKKSDSENKVAAKRQKHKEYMAARRARLSEEKRNAQHHAKEMADVQVVLNQLIDTVCLTLTRVNETIEQANSKCKKNPLRIASARITETDAEAVLKRLITSVCIAEAHDNESQQQAECHQQDVAAHRNRNIKQNAPSLNIARKGDQPQLHYVGQMNILCPHCNALKFANVYLFKCYHGDKVSLPPLKYYPDELRNLLLGNSAKEKISRKYSKI